MKRNKKLTITALVAMLFMAIAVTFLSFSHADEEITDDSLLMADATSAIDVGSKTNIDYIITNSYSTDTEVDPYYNIVEIYSDTASNLDQFVNTNSQFEQFVINAYRTTKKNQTNDKTLNPGKIKYVKYKASEITNNDEDKLKTISNADLIYVNQGKTSFSKTNDICEELYNILHTYAVGDYKPIIVNSESKSGSKDDSSTSSESLSSLTKDVFSSGMYYYTFSWDTSISVNDFLAHRSGSMYLGINGTRQNSKGKWTILEDADGNKKNMARFLIVSSTGTSTSKTMVPNLIPSSLDEFATTGYHLIGETSDYAKPADTKLYDIKKNLSNIVVTSIYNAKYTTPDVIQVEQCTLEKIEDGTYDLSKYDFIILDESLTGSTVISRDLYNKLAGAMYGGISMVYSSTLGDSSVTTTTNTVTDYQAYNYLEFYYMVATNENLARYDNVMVTSTNKFNIMTAGTEAGAGGIADLINKSTYRGIGGKGSSSNMYTVLEIEPCYPIDLDTASANGGYYTIPANVLNDVDKNTLPVNSSGVITSEYYDWELTKYKIADAVGIDVNKINLVHMSTEELAASKEPILGNYDLVYIGGNRTALKEPLQWRNVINIVGWGNVMASNGITDSQVKFLPVYNMFSHNGDMVNVAGDAAAVLGSSGSTGPKGGNESAQVYVPGVGYQSSFTLLNGNDITFDRYKELEKYINAGLPVIVESHVSEAYDTMVGLTISDTMVDDMWNALGWNGQYPLAQSIGKQPGEVTTAEKRALINADSINPEYLQNAIDPDSNMRKVLDVCSSKRTTTGSTIAKINGKDVSGVNTVLWGIKNDSDMLTFGEEAGKYVNNLVKGSATRPKLTVTSMPIVYNYYDLDTRLDKGELNFTFDVTVPAGHKYTTKLWVDDDGNNTFSKDMTDTADVTDHSLSLTLADSFFGPIYWKLEVTDTTNDLTAFVTGVSYIKKTGDPQPVRVLQIMPGDAVKSSNGKITASIGEGADGSNGSNSNSLYFCPMCQNAYQRLEHNPTVNNETQKAKRYLGNYDENNWDEVGRATSGQNPYLGIHQHVFGIPKYDSNLTIDGSITGVDDWSTNLADDISDLYDFELDILLVGEYEQYCQEVAKAYKFTPEQISNKIAGFSIDATDPDYATYTSLTDDEARAKFITKREYQAQADAAYQIYKDKDDEVKAKEAVLRAELEAAANNNTEGFGKDLAEVLKTKRYSDIFTSISSSGSNMRDCYGHAAFASLTAAFWAYRDALDPQINAYNEYKRCLRFANPDNWLYANYDMVILGPSDVFGGDDITNDYAIADLISYVDAKGSLLLFHDTMTLTRDAYSCKLTEALRPYFGMDRNKGLSGTAKQGQYYLPYKASTEDSDKYFMTNLSYKSVTDDTRYDSWVNDLKLGFSNFFCSKYLSRVAYTDAVSIGNDSANTVASSPYKYASIYWGDAAHSYTSASKSEKDNDTYGTDKASQNNKGIVTQYPFTLSESLNIAGTHPQVYAADLENSNMTVWYSLAGGTNGKASNGTPSNSSLFAASRNDGMDSYFIYSYGNVSYCGAGHSKITGIGKDNNDERRLYINIIVNSVRPSVSQPSITVYDYQTEKKKQKEGKDYLIEVKNTDDWPTFSFKAIVDTSDASNTLARVRIYYDLDYLTATGNKDAYVNNAFHILIADMTKDKNGNPLKSGTIYDVGKELTKLQLKPEYFYPYNQEYTYIVIEVTDSKGNVSYQRIKVKLLPHLFEMTQNDINIVLDRFGKS